MTVPVEAAEETDTVLTEGPVKEEHLDPDTAVGLQNVAPGTLGTPQRPPPPPESEPPMFTPYRPMEGHDTSTGSPAHDSSHDTMFDYSGIAEPATSESKMEDDFEFLAPDCPPPVPPPLNDSAQLTPPPSPPPLPVSSPPGLDSTLAEEAAVVAPSEVLEGVPTEEMFTKLLDDESLILGSTSRRGRKMGKAVTPRRALDEAFEQLDTGPDDAYSSEEELDPAYSTIRSRPASERKAPQSPATGGGETGDVSPEGVGVSPPDVSELYAKVNKPQRQRAAEVKTWPRAFTGDQAYAVVEVPEKVDMPVYATVDKSRKMRKTIGLAPGEVRPEVVHKAASVDDVYDVQYAEVDTPKRSSMIEHHYHSVTTQLATPPDPPNPAAATFEATFEDDWGRLQENETSLLKLEKMFGPEFARLSNRAKQESDTKVSTTTLLSGTQVSSPTSSAPIHAATQQDAPGAGARGEEAGESGPAQSPLCQLLG